LPGLVLAHETFGSLPLSRLMEPAVRRCRAGVEVNAEGEHTFRLLWPILARDPALVELFGIEGAPPRKGTVRSNPRLGDTLEAFGREGAVPQAVQDALVDDFGPERGGLISRADVDGYSAALSKPLSIEVGAWTALTSPAAGGHLVEVILRSLIDGAPSDDEAAEVVRFALASAAGHGERQQVISRGSTTHVSVLDNDGGAVSVTLTNGEGCGHLIGDTGIQCNNFLGEEDLNPHGFHRHRAGHRIPTMLAPTVALRDGLPALALGSGGSNRIRTAVAQVLYRVAVLGAPLDEAVRAPRIHAEGKSVWIELEGLADPDAARAGLDDAFDAVHGFLARDFFFGGVHAVSIEADGRWVGFGDPRRGGETLSV
jgi:gamma-glutamyltranspeptidase/glutathione hydrolase